MVASPRRWTPWITLGNWSAFKRYLPLRCSKFSHVFLKLPNKQVKGTTSGAFEQFAMHTQILLNALLQLSCSDELLGKHVHIITNVLWV